LEKDLGEGNRDKATLGIGEKGVKGYEVEAPREDKTKPWRGGAGKGREELLNHGGKKRKRGQSFERKKQSQRMIGDSQVKIRGGNTEKKKCTPS